MNYPKTVVNLIECYKKFPGVGEKTAERMALATLNMEKDALELFSKSLLDSKTLIKRCERCNNLTENTLCDICTNEERNHKLICVVEEPKNAFAFEKVGTYKGVYHILDGLISPLDGINPEDININSLIDRITDEGIEEVVIAVRPSIEGETTSLYILKKLEKLNVTVSKIAHGIPLGADMDYIDSMTLEMALEDRKKISN